MLPSSCLNDESIPVHGESDADVEALLNQEYPLFTEMDGPLVVTVDTIASERELLTQNDIARERSGYGSGADTQLA
jgi:hypothetical protein